MQERVVPPVLRGEKRICLAISMSLLLLPDDKVDSGTAEPSAGSDVANLTTVAKKTEDGKHYIVNGEKVSLLLAIFSSC